MNTPDGQLNRLLAAARRAPPRETEGMPPFLRTRILAHWRAAAAEEAVPSLALVFRCALGLAMVVMLASIAWSYNTLAQEPENDVAIANFELRADVTP